MRLSEGVKQKWRIITYDRFESQNENSRRIVLSKVSKRGEKCLVWRHIFPALLASFSPREDAQRLPVQWVTFR